MDESTRKLFAQHISVNIKHFGNMVSSKIPSTTQEDFKDNYELLMGIYSSVTSVLECSLMVFGIDPKDKEEDISDASAIAASVSYLFGNSSKDPAIISTLVDIAYKKQLLLPISEEYKVFYDYFKLIKRESDKHNKRLNRVSRKQQK